MCQVSPNLSSVTLPPPPHTHTPVFIRGTAYTLQPWLIRSYGGHIWTSKRRTSTKDYTWHHEHMQYRHGLTLLMCMALAIHMGLQPQVPLALHPLAQLGGLNIPAKVVLLPCSGTLPQGMEELPFGPPSRRWRMIWGYQTLLPEAAPVTSWPSG